MKPLLEETTYVVAVKEKNIKDAVVKLSEMSPQQSASVQV
jgi:hypothetical protein